MLLFAAPFVAFAQSRPHAPEHSTGWTDKRAVTARHWIADRGTYEADLAYYVAPTGLLDADYLRARSRLIRSVARMRQATPGDPPEHDG